MSFQRKIKRQYMASKKCCGMNMLHKDGYDDGMYELWVCQKCGKERFIHIAHDWEQQYKEGETNE